MTLARYCGAIGRPIALAASSTSVPISGFSSATVLSLSSEVTGNLPRRTADAQGRHLEPRRKGKEHAKGRAHVPADFRAAPVYNRAMTVLLDLGLHALRSAYRAGTLDVARTIDEVLKRVVAAGDDKVWITRTAAEQ